MYDKKLIARIRENWSIIRQARLVVAVSGYWNPLHAGHLAYIKAAKKLGELLVCIVNNDIQVGLKGSVPFMACEERCDIMASLRWVDLAIPSIDTDDRSVSHTLELVTPHIFANGGDVTGPEQCRERATCERLGIEMRFGVGGTAKLNSSSKLIAGALR